MKSNSNFLDEEKNFTGVYSKRVFLTIFQIFKPYKYRTVLTLLMGLLARFFILFFTKVIGIWADHLSDNKGVGFLYDYFREFSHQDFLHFLIAITVTGFILNTFFRIAISRICCHAVSTFYDEVTFRVGRFPLRFFDTNPVGRIIARFSSDYGSIFRMFGGPMGEFFCIVFDLILIIVLVAFTGPYYLPIMIVAIVANVAIYWTSKDRLRQERRNLSYHRSPMISHFAETAQGKIIIRGYGREQIFEQKFREFSGKYFHSKIRMNFSTNLFSYSMIALSALLAFFVALLGIYFIDRKILTIGELAVCFTFVTLITSNIQQFFDWMVALEESLTGIERLAEYLERPLEDGQSLPSKAVLAGDWPTYSAQEEDRLKIYKSTLGLHLDEKIIDFHQVAFRYGEELPLVLKNLNFSVNQGEKIGILGKTGSGKTSIFQILLGLYPLTGGMISVNGLSLGQDLRVGNDKLNLEKIRGHFSLIAQDISIFRGDLRSNLTLDKNCTDQKIQEVLETVGLGDWMGSHIEGLNYFLEEKGSNLSQGEKQLFNLARCILSNRPIVLMDEATSMIDPKTEDLLMDRTKKLLSDKTQLIIAHRLSTIEDCDRLLWIQDGVVVDFDRPELILPRYTQKIQL